MLEIPSIVFMVRVAIKRNIASLVSAARDTDLARFNGRLCCRSSPVFSRACGRALGQKLCR